MNTAPPRVNADGLHWTLALVEFSPLQGDGPHGSTRRCLASWICTLAGVPVTTVAPVPYCVQADAAAILLGLDDPPAALALFCHDGTPCEATPATVAELRERIHTVLGLRV